jgi:hypothetical protein
MHERSIIASTASYERWLGTQLHVVPGALDRKHRLMRRDAFTFLRATYYRFAERLPDLVPELLEAPRLWVVGDLHAENFGTWRDREGRLVWGIDDLDEADRLPYTVDLVRLATSCLLATEAGHMRVDSSLVADAILSGYTRGVVGGAEPAVLAERRRWLANLVRPALPDSRAFWRKLEDLPAVPSRLPGAARAALKAAAPGPGWRYTLHLRISGVGSLGHPHYVALGPWQGGLVARELKAMAPAATQWLAEGRRAPVPRARYSDPLAVEHEGWLVRRLSPDRVKLDLAKIDRKRADQRLLAAMGEETARHHLRVRRNRKAIHDDLVRRPDDWLADAARRLSESCRADFEAWRTRTRR